MLLVPRQSSSPLKGSSQLLGRRRLAPTLSWRTTYKQTSPEKSGLIVRLAVRRQLKKATHAAHSMRPIFRRGKTGARTGRQILRLRMDRSTAQIGYEGSHPTPRELVQQL